MRSTLLASTLVLLLSGCAHWNTPMRKTPDLARNPGESALLRSDRPGGYNYGCSFIEFDGRGGFLKFDQFESAKKELDRLKAHSNVLLVIYCHGWQNNSQSPDVGRFTSFLRKLADSPAIRKKGMRVQGVYLGWRGSSFFPVAAAHDPNTDPAIVQDFGGAPTNPRWQTPEALGSVLAIPKVLTYWAVKPRAEFYVSRVPLARAVFELSFDLKSPGQQAIGRDHEVFVIGHSFGALLLEQAIGQASVGLLASEWNRGDGDARWPFNLIVFLNSAAPSLYAKQLAEFLQSDRRHGAKPRIVSLTSTGDQATGIVHEAGNFLTQHSVDLQRQYHPRHGVTVRAGYYYDRTPGHNKYLINRAVVDAPDQGKLPPLDNDAIFAANLEPRERPEEFYTRIGGAMNGRVHRWRVEDLTKNGPMQKRMLLKSYATNYWIGTVPPEIIKDHGDIWSPSCMQMLAGIYRMTQQLPRKSPTAAPTSRPD